VLAGPDGPATLVLDEYKGSGAFGLVYRAHSLTTAAVYAVKFPQAGVFGGGLELQAFLNEVTAAKEVVHPNVVRVLHVEASPKGLSPYIVMEYVAGGTLRDALDRVRKAKAKVEPERVRSWCRSLAEALAAINAKVLHRDIKPDNILLDGEIPKVSDFGLAKLVGAATRPNTFKGGQHMMYMAPEGWTQGRNVLQTDMYSLGIVFHEIAALKYPFKLPEDPTDVLALRRMHLFDAPSFLRTSRTDLPIGFCTIVSRMMEKKVDDRFRSWAEVLDALDAAWSGVEASAPESPIVQNIIAELAKQQEEETKARLEREAALALAQENHEVDTHQAQKLVSSIDEAFAKVIAQGGGLVDLTKGVPYKPVGLDRMYSLGKARLELQFFRVEREMEVRPFGTVRFAALLRDRTGAGYNYLLVRRTEQDTYGSWYIGKVEVSPLIAARAGARVWAPSARWFGFPSDMIEQLGRATCVTHVYQVSVTVADDAQFLVFLHEAVQGAENPTRPRDR
jgi:serine/threonine protein kinase